MQAVLISIQPKWVELIASGKKTVEVRKTKPKLEMPFKCYIYCTNGNGTLNDTLMSSDRRFVLNQKVIGEFVCDRIITAECGSYYKIPMEISQVGADYLLDYADEKTIYGWHISDLVIYDKPRKLGEFYTIDNEAVQKCEYRFQSYYNFTDTGYIKNGYACSYKDQWCDKCKTKPLTRPPQSWMYVEEL